MGLRGVGPGIQNRIDMGEKTNCPRCDGKLVWNGTTMACLACSYTAPTKSVQPKSEKKMPFSRKNKKS